MDSNLRAAMDLLKPHIVEASGINIFNYPGTRKEFADNLINTGIECCLIKLALKFEDNLIDLDLLFFVVDVIKTVDGSVIFYSPESRLLDLKIIRRPSN